MHKTLRRFLDWQFLLPLLVFIVFLVANWGIYGPAYLSDEIGYLSKASTIAGQTIHVPSSWFGGYSLLITPAFLLSHNPFVVWKIILVLNALMWAGSTWLLRYFLQKIKPKIKPRTLQLATFGAMVYPSWISMSGYAFSTSGFVLCLMAALAALIKSQLKSPHWLLIAGLLAGYLCWIHPIGFVFLAVFSLFMIAHGIATRRQSPILAAGVAIVLGIIYPTIINPLFDSIMSSGSFSNTAYAAQGSTILHSLTTWAFWTRVPEQFVGLVFSIVVATFGVVVYAAIPVINNKNWRAILKDPAKFVSTLAVASLVALLIFLTLAGSGPGLKTPDKWIYERYSDMYVLPLIGLGLIAEWRKKWSATIALAVVAAGIFLSAIVSSKNTIFVSINKASLQSFWPMSFDHFTHTQTFWAWGIIGACGIILLGLINKMDHKRMLALLLIPICMTFVVNYVYHKNILDTYSHVSPQLMADITKNYARGTCVGFTADNDTDERFELYSFYLRGLDLRRMTLSEWQSSNCTGPYLTYATNPTTIDKEIIYERKN